MLKKCDQSILVPVSTWYGNAIDLYKKNIYTDIGAIAEALVYYDTVLINVKNKHEFDDLFEWFKISDSPDSLLTLMKEGSVFFYFYNFDVNPLFDPARNAFMFRNINEKHETRMEVFNRRVVGSMQRYFNT